MADDGAQTRVAMDSVLQRYKIWAAFVMISFLAFLLAAWATGAARHRAVASQPCQPADAKVKWTPLEVSPPTTSLAADLGERPGCKAAALAAQLRADGFFLFSYGALNLFIFLFLAARAWTKRRLVPVLVVSGILLSVAMVGADLWENQVLRGWLAGAPLPADGPLRPSAIKWLALGISGAVAGAAYLSAPSRWGKLPALTGFAALALVLLGLFGHFAAGAGIVDAGMSAIALFWVMAALDAAGVLIGGHLHGRRAASDFALLTFS